MYDYFQIVTSSPSHLEFFLKHYGIPLKMSFFHLTVTFVLCHKGLNQTQTGLTNVLRILFFKALILFIFCRDEE